MDSVAVSEQSASGGLPWREAVRKYQDPKLWRSLWQIANSLLPYLALWYLMALSLRVSLWLTLALSILASGFLVRLFIIFHDCGHGSFFKSKRANHFVGVITGILTFTPYYQWRHEHAVHHATSGNLEKRGVGDVWTLTVQEYLALPPLKRLAYRLYRHPLIMFGLGPLYMFVIAHRLVRRGASPRERNSVIATNLAVLGIAVAMSLLIGVKAYLLIQLFILLIGGGAGVWLFYVQHQFEGVYWEDSENWDFAEAALKGSSYYRLPKVLQWFTGNIGIHHIHHLSPRIPNYRLQECQDENPIFHTIQPVTLLTSLKALGMRLYDEQQRMMIGFRELRRRYGSVRA